MKYNMHYYIMIWFAAALFYFLYTHFVSKNNSIYRNLQKILFYFVQNYENFYMK